MHNRYDVTAVTTSYFQFKVAFTSQNNFHTETMHQLKFALFAALVAAFATFSVQAQSTESPYASENCKKGCVLGEAPHSALTVYVGAAPKSYRICALNAFVRFSVDDREIPIREGSCSDVNGRVMTLTNGIIRFGLLPS